MLVGSGGGTVRYETALSGGAQAAQQTDQRSYRLQGALPCETL
jgi:hypothetical protein